MATRLNPRKDYNQEASPKRQGAWDICPLPTPTLFRSLCYSIVTIKAEATVAVATSVLSFDAQQGRARRVLEQKIQMNLEMLLLHLSAESNQKVAFYNTIVTCVICKIWYFVWSREFIWVHWNLQKPINTPKSPTFGFQFPSWSSFLIHWYRNASVCIQSALCSALSNTLGLVDRSPMSQDVSEPQYATFQHTQH